MRVGEMVRLDCSSAYAYGDAGAPPLIPSGASMSFELELVSVRDLMTSHNPEEVNAPLPLSTPSAAPWQHVRTTAGY
jgi:hypothetical protein